MKQLFLALALFLSLTVHAQTPAWNWLHSVAGANSVTDMAMLPTGDFLVTGRFDNSLQLSNRLLTSPGRCLYVARLNASGQVQQVTKIAVGSDALLTSVAADRSGNAYLTGYFRGTLTYGSGTQVTAQSPGATDVLLVKYAANGTIGWVRQASSTGPEPYSTPNTGWSVAVDAAGNSYVGGSVSGATVQFGSRSFSNRQNQAFVASYSPQGTVRWVNVWSAPAGSEGRSAVRATAVDASGNCYVGGNFSASLVVNGTSLQPADANSNLFLLRFSTSQGQLQWAKAPAGYGDGRNVATDAAGKIYFAESFSGAATFGATTLTSTGGTDIFLTRYNAQGQSEWATALGGPNYDFATDIAVDQMTGQAYLIGSQANSQSFITRFQATGQVASTTLVGGPGTSAGGCLVLDGRNNVYTAGTATGTCQFGPYATAGTATNCYLARLGTTTAARTQAGALESTVYPNPAQDHFTLRVPAAEAQQLVKATLYNSFGRIVAQQTLRGTEATFNTAALPGGLYVLNLESGQQVTSQLITVR
ncbi:T9SS type A sorting domain-containing protein [Hymenobacter aquaticus]|uniref:T9SS type A sorting domain-containing protein n=1 Tax=Hymenobacter aquaticus TaxID=1867101 RepID=A0A4Z0PZB8_9BACT|nr:T9SS type A sorting domain-containing protein [Hymenobacter aquaticus]TGE22243.1 T9SS type A sorting domain-containing protein [Hymenobacter aquaticus]